MTDTSTSTPTKVNVWLVADQGGRRLPSRAITDGSPAPVVVDVRPFPLRRLRVTLPVDAATARRIVRVDRWAMIGVMLTLCYLVFALAVLVLLVVAFLTHRWTFMAVTTMVAPAGLGCPLLMLVIFALRPVQYPRVKPGGRVLIQAVDWAVADEWAALNPPGAIQATPFVRSGW